MPVILALIGFPIIAFKALREPIFALMLGAYVYFAIPSREFRFPDAPYQAAFFGWAALTAFRAASDTRRRARLELDEVGIATAHAALDQVRDRMFNALLTAGAARETQARAKEAGIAEGEAQALAFVEENCPATILEPIRRALAAAIHAACDVGAKEAQAVADLTPAQQGRGNLRAALDARVLPLMNDTLEKTLRDAVHNDIQRLVEADEKDVTKRRASGSGPLGIPMGRGPLVALLTNSGLWLHFGFIVLSYVGAMRAKYSQEAAYDSGFMVTVVLLIPLVAIITTCRTARHLRLFTWAWLFGVWHLSMNGVMLWLRNGGRADDIGGQGGEANFLGAIIVTVAPVAFSMAVTEKRTILRLAGLFAGGCYTLGILACGSRGALVAFVASMGYWMTQTHRRTLAVGLMMVASAGFLTMAPPSFWERMDTIVGEKEANKWVVNPLEPSAAERMVLWDLAIELFKENPWMGIGPRQYPFVSAERTTITDAYFGQRGMQVHNSWLQIAAEYGIFGLVIWGGNYLLAIFCFRLARRRMRDRPGWEWFPGYCLGFEAGALAGGIAITFSSFQWYDYIYWTMVSGPLVLQIATETAEQLDWYRPRVLSLLGMKRPAPRYGPPSADGLQVGTIDLRQTPAIQSPAIHEPGR